MGRYPVSGNFYPDGRSGFRYGKFLSRHRSGLPKTTIFTFSSTAVFRKVGTFTSFQKHEQICYLDNLVCLTSHQLTNHTMPFCKISCDLKLAAIRPYECEILPLWDILDIMYLSQRTFFHILKLWHKTGNVITHKYGNLAGWPQILSFNNIHYVLQLVCLHPDWFLDELFELLKTNCFISIHYVTIHQELKRVGVLYKKLKLVFLSPVKSGFFPPKRGNLQPQLV